MPSSNLIPCHRKRPDPNLRIPSIVALGLMMGLISCSGPVLKFISIPTLAGPAFNRNATTTPKADTATWAAGKTMTMNTSTPKPTDWKLMPVIPVVTRRAMEIYKKGIALGNNPNAFSKVADCEGTVTWFLGDFDNDPPTYSLGPYTYLSEVVSTFHGSYSRTSVAVKKGGSASMMLSQLWTDKDLCNPDEPRLACEYRLNKPILALIALGTNDADRADTFESDMRQILQYSIDNGVIPVLTTKADNMEGNGSINATMARLAVEYDIPLWNFYAAVQPLPNHGLQEDAMHLTWEPNYFDNPFNMLAAWPVRNLTALQTLDSLRRGLLGLPQPTMNLTSVP
jgi:hypothetical protein